MRTIYFYKGGPKHGNRQQEKVEIGGVNDEITDLSTPSYRRVELSGEGYSGYIAINIINHVCQAFVSITTTSTFDAKEIYSDMPEAIQAMTGVAVNPNGASLGLFSMDSNRKSLRLNSTTKGGIYTSLVYLTKD